MSVLCDSNVMVIALNWKNACRKWSIKMYTCKLSLPNNSPELFLFFQDVESENTLWTNVWTKMVTKQHVVRNNIA